MKPSTKVERDISARFFMKDRRFMFGMGEEGGEGVVREVRGRGARKG